MLGKRPGARGIAGEVEDTALVRAQKAVGARTHDAAIVLAIDLVDVAVRRLDGLEKARGHGAQELLRVVGLGEKPREVEELLEDAVAGLERAEQERLLERAGHDVNGAAGVLERRLKRARPVAVELDDPYHPVLRQQRKTKLTGEAVFVVDLQILVAQASVVAILNVRHDAVGERRHNDR